MKIKSRDPYSSISYHFGLGSNPEGQRGSIRAVPLLPLLATCRDSSAWAWRLGPVQRPCPACHYLRLLFASMSWNGLCSPILASYERDGSLSVENRSSPPVDPSQRHPTSILRSRFVITFRKYRSNGENGDVHPTNTMVRQISVATENRTALIETAFPSVTFERGRMTSVSTQVLQ